MMRSKLLSTAPCSSARIGLFRSAHRVRFASSSTSQAPSSSSRVLTIGALGAAAATAVYLSSTQRQPLLTEASGSQNGYETQSQLHKGQIGSIKPAVFLWGRNTHNVVSYPVPPATSTVFPITSSSSPDLVKKPRRYPFFDNQLLRDLALSETYGLAVLLNGDVVQWGAKNIAEPRLVLKHQDVISVHPAGEKIFALTRKGEVVVFPSNGEKQAVGQEERKRKNAEWWRMGYFGVKDYGTDLEVLTTDSKLGVGEKFTSLSAGQSHLLALTSSGRCFSLPLSLAANTHGQLGVRRVALLPLLPQSSLETGAQLTELVPDLGLNDKPPPPPMPANLDPLLLPNNPSGRPLPASALPPPPPPTPAREVPREDPREGDIRFATTLHEIPALRGLEVKKLVAGGRHSLALTRDGKVLGWGGNFYGQLGLGVSLSYPVIPTPTEIPLIKTYPRSTSLICTEIAAGGNQSYFIVEKEDLQTRSKDIDVLSSGNGQFGGMGNGSWAHTAQPVRVKTISGLREWSEDTQTNAAIPIKHLSVGKTHIAAVLDNAVEQPGGIKFGRDVFVWGHNEYYQLGTGKRSNLSTPQHLPPLPYPGLTAPPASATAILTSAPVASGTTSPMPHSRLQLAPALKVDGRWAEETIVAGDGASAVYWKVLSP